MPGAVRADAVDAHDAVSEHAPPAVRTAESGRDAPPPMPERVRCAAEGARDEVGGGARAERGGFGGEVRAERVQEPSCLMTRRVGEDVPGSARDAVVYGRYVEVEDCAVAWWRRKVHDMYIYIRTHPSI